MSGKGGQEQYFQVNISYSGSQVDGKIGPVNEGDFCKKVSFEVHRGTCAGESLTLSCEAGGSPPPTVTWWRGHSLVGHCVIIGIIRIGILIIGILITSWWGMSLA